MRVIVLLSFLLIITSAFSQPLNTQRDTTKKARVHSPTRAMIFSAVVPGLGQAYNKKYWKMPLVYATMGSTIYFFNSNNKLYKEYKQAYVNKTDSLSNTIDLYPDYTEAQLQELSSYYRRYRDLNVILTAVFYTINIADAYVDAHLATFDVSDDLSMNIRPAFGLSASRKPAAGLTLCFTF